MIETLLVATLVALVVGFLSVLATRKIVLSRMDIYTNKAQAKAKAIEHEAELLLHKSKLAIQEKEFEAKRKYEEQLALVRSEQEAHRCEIEKKEHAILRDIERREEQILQKERLTLLKAERIEREISFYEKLQRVYEEKQIQLVAQLENYTGMTADEARKMLIAHVEELSKADLANAYRKIEQQDKQKLQRHAAYILAQATTRYAGEFAAERLVNTIVLPNDDLKGRIIGKEGRNIKALEQLMGVDILIDETPNAIEVSSHNLYRRAIATRTIELLIEDGRIQPARIEEIFEKVTQEFEEQILHEGEQIVLDMGVTGIHPDVVKLIGKLRYRASYGQNALAHTLEVAHFAGIITAELGGNEMLARRAGLLHDIGKAMTHEIGGNHVDIGADICRRYSEDPVVINAIYAHHDQQEVGSIECAAVCAADALSAARPGARREVLENFVRRVKAIEEIALSKEGVKHAYAINAGREVRVIVNAQLVNDAQSATLAHDIARQIEQTLQYPGDVKVNVIREERFVAVAK